MCRVYLGVSACYCKTPSRPCDGVARRNRPLSMIGVDAPRKWFATSETASRGGGWKAAASGGGGLSRDEAAGANGSVQSGGYRCKSGRECSWACRMQICTKSSSSSSMREEELRHFRHPQKQRAFDGEKKAENHIPCAKMLGCVPLLAGVVVV